MFNHKVRLPSALKHALGVGLLAGLLGTAGATQAQDPVKVGVFLPYSGTIAKLGDMTTKGLKMAIDEAGGKLGGRPVEYTIVDSEANASRAITNMQKLVSGENVDVVVGPIHSGVAMGALKIARQEGVPLIIPNAGLNIATRQLCAPNIFRTSFSNWQPDHPMGKQLWDRGHKRVVTISWRYAAGDEHLGAFEEAFEAEGGEIVRRILVPFPDVDFQAHLTEIASLKPDAVYAFFAGGGSVKFVKDYAAAGLKDQIPLVGTGSLTEGTLPAQGESAEGLLTSWHYADTLDTEANRRFRSAFEERYGEPADVFAMQGYDTGTLLIEALEAVNGNTEDRDALIEAMEQVTFEDSPRGPWRLSKSHNPIQNIYLREVRDGQNIVVDVTEALEDPATGCEMAR